MSKASTSITVYMTERGSTYTPRLDCDKGEIVQYYNGNSCTPDFSGSNSQNQPTIKLTVQSSIANEGPNNDGLMRPDSVTWYYNGTQINFVSGNVDTTGKFERIIPTGADTRFGLKIIGNIAVDLFNREPGNISCDIVLPQELTTLPLKASIRVTVMKESSEGGPKVRIVAGDDNFFSLNKDTDTCILEAQVSNNGVIASSSDFTYQWQKLDGGADDGWSNLPNPQGFQRTISASEVDTASDFRVKVFQNGVYVGSDVQAVFDNSDSFMVIADTNPPGGRISPSEGINQCVVTPQLIRRDSGAVVSGAEFRYLVRDGAGNVLNKFNTLDNVTEGQLPTANPGSESVNSSNWMDNPNEQYSAAHSSYTVTLAQIKQAGGNLSVAILANFNG